MKAVALSIALLSFAWLGGVVWMITRVGEEPFTGLASFYPANVYAELLGAVGVERLGWLSHASTWLDGLHPAWMSGAALVGGAMIHGSASRRFPLRGGRGVFVAWACILPSVQALGLGRASLCAAVGFLVILAIPVLATVMTRDVGRSVEDTRWDPLCDGLAQNCLHFVVIPLVPVLLLGWLVEPYGFGSMRTGSGPAAA